MRVLSIILSFAFLLANQCTAQTVSIQEILQNERSLILKSSRKTIGPAIDAISNSGLPEAKQVLSSWKEKALWMRKDDEIFFRGVKVDKKTYELFDLETDESVGMYRKSALKQIKPNSGIRALISNALVRFQLLDPDPKIRLMALAAIQRQPSQEALSPLRNSIANEPDPILKKKKLLLERLLTISFDDEEQERLNAINTVSGDLNISVRATLSRLLEKNLRVFPDEIPKQLNLANQLSIDELGLEYAYDHLAKLGLEDERITHNDIKSILTRYIDSPALSEMKVERLNTAEARLFAFNILVEKNISKGLLSPAEMRKVVKRYNFAEIYSENSPAVTKAATAALERIERKVAFSQIVDLSLDAISLASIYFLAAIGLAITFGVMGVINMAHGEFIMMGAYTGYLVQQIIPENTLSILIAFPLAFVITFGAGVLMERLVIRWLYNRPLETLLATFGISIALQQLAKNIFGTQARPLTSPDWLSGALVINDVVSISVIRIAIFVLAILFFTIFLFIMKNTRYGLETRAVTQNPKMAASMGINTDKINMLTFGLGSGIAGVAGVAIGLFAKVTSELGSDYIVQSFMTVVVGGVGNIWGTLAGAAMIGIFQKGIEWFNPSNTLAAQTFMIVFIIIFIQFRPRGIIALKGRAAGD